MRLLLPLLLVLAGCPREPAPLDLGDGPAGDGPAACNGGAVCGQDSDCYPPVGRLCAGGCCVTPSWR